MEKRAIITYDGSGKKIMEQNKKGTSYFFYRSGQLINAKVSSEGQISHIIGYHMVAESTDNVIDKYYENNYKGDVTTRFKKNRSQWQPISVKCT